MKTKKMLECLDAWDAGRPGVQLPGVGETLSALRDLRVLLTDARSLIDTLNANTQGQTSAEATDEVTDGICRHMIARIDAAVPRVAQPAEKETTP